MAAAATAGWGFGSTDFGSTTSGNGSTGGFTGPTAVSGTGGSGVSQAGNGATAAGNGPATTGTHLGLPRRVRQANLAPQLRGQTGSDAHQADLHSRESARPASRSPEQTSSRLSALQDGWLRGRLDDLDHTDAGLDILGGRPGAGGETESNDREV
jgi:hypothetical protein